MDWSCEQLFSISPSEEQLAWESNAALSEKSPMCNRVYLDGLNGSTKSSVTLTVCFSHMDLRDTVSYYISGLEAE